MQIVLASTSPRRKEIMSWLDIDFQSVKPEVEEKNFKSNNPEKLTRLLAEEKAKSLLSFYKDALIIGSDAVVSFDNQILEKPVDIEDQRKMLYLQKGKPAAVVCAVCLINANTGEKRVEVKKTDYTMADLTDQQIEDYLKTGKGLDKAGGFGLQDENGLFIGKMLGCYTNAMGFPICLVAEILKEFEIKVEVNIKKIVEEKTGRSC